MPIFLPLAEAAANIAFPLLLAILIGMNNLLKNWGSADDRLSDGTLPRVSLGRLRL
jgi:hypothetical protein